MVKVSSNWTCQTTVSTWCDRRTGRHFTWLIFITVTVDLLQAHASASHTDPLCDFLNLVQKKKITSSNSVTTVLKRLTPKQTDIKKLLDFFSKLNRRCLQKSICTLLCYITALFLCVAPNSNVFFIRKLCCSTHAPFTWCSLAHDAPFCTHRASCMHLSVNALCERENMKHLEQHLEQTYGRHNGIGKQSLAPVKWPQVRFQTKREQALKLDLKVGIRSTVCQSYLCWKNSNNIFLKILIGLFTSWTFKSNFNQFCVRPLISNNYVISPLLPIYWYSGSNVRAVHDTSNIAIKVGLRPFEN